jgi:hypothetical protein
MTLETLLDALPTPAHPVETVDADQWETFELITGITLPDDYKAYLRVFGTGIIGGVITPHNPFCKRPLWKIHYTCRDWMRESAGIHKYKHLYGEQTFPYAIYPEPGGVLPWGETDNGDRLFWLTTGLPNEWTILMNEVRSSDFELFECSMTEFLRGLITGDIQSDIIPYDCLDRDDLFTPL